MSKHTQLVSNPQATLRMIKDALLLNLKEDGAIKQFFSIFHTPNSNIDRIKHVYQYLLRYQMMPKKPCAVKCDRFSIETKNTGNQLFIEKIYIRAIKHYNEAIRFAASSSVINITFANRSAVLFNLKKYRESILDINRAIAAGYSKKLTPKLLERKKQCEEAIKRTQKSDADYEIENEKIRQEIFEFPEKRMAGVSCASSSIDISFFESMGRGIVATEDIQPGQVLVVEDPYMTNLDKKNYNFRCFHCCALNLAMIPCKTCTYVMYCNEKCRNESWKQGHEFECGIMPRLLNMGFDDFGMMISLRILLKAKSQHSSWEELFKITDAADKVSDPKLKGFSLDSENVLTYDINNYRSIYSSGNDSENIDGLEIFLKCLTSAVLLFMLKEYTSLFADRPNISEEMFAMEDDCIWRVGSLLYRHLSPNVTKIPICAYREISPTRELMYGEGVYAFYSLFNHSCCHNTNFVFRGNTLSILAISPIKKGEQVFTHYGSVYKYWF